MPPQPAENESLRHAARRNQLYPPMFRWWWVDDWDRYDISYQSGSRFEPRDHWHIHTTYVVCTSMYGDQISRCIWYVPGPLMPMHLQYVYTGKSETKYHPYPLSSGRGLLSPSFVTIILDEETSAANSLLIENNIPKTWMAGKQSILISISMSKGMYRSKKTKF